MFVGAVRRKLCSSGEDQAKESMIRSGVGGSGVMYCLYRPRLAPRLCRCGTVLFGSVVAVCVLSGLVSFPSVPPVAAALAVLIVAVAPVPVRPAGFGKQMEECINGSFQQIKSYPQHF